MESSDEALLRKVLARVQYSSDPIVKKTKIGLKASVILRGQNDKTLFLNNHRRLLVAAAGEAIFLPSRKKLLQNPRLTFSTSELLLTSGPILL